MPSVFDSLDVPGTQVNAFDSLDEPIVQPENPFTALDGPSAAASYLNLAARGVSAEGVMAVGEGLARLGAAGSEEATGLVPGSSRVMLEQRLQALTREEQQLNPRLPSFSDESMGFGEVLTPERQARLNQVTNERLAVLSELENRRQQGTLGDAARSIAGGRESVREALPVRRDVQEGLPGQIVQGVGQAVGTLPFYVIPGVGGAVGPATSVAQIYQEGYDDAIQSGADPVTAHEAGLAYVPASALDVVGDKLIVGRFLKPLIGQPIKKVIVDLSSRALAEGATETGQQAILNYVASELAGYDPDRPLTKDLFDSFVVGTAVGFVASGTAQVVQGREQAQQVVEGAGQAITQASEQVAGAQQTLQQTAAQSAVATRVTLENPEVESLDDLGAAQQRIAQQPREAQQASQQAGQQLQQGQAVLQDATVAEQQARLQLATLDEIAQPLLRALAPSPPPLSQPDTPLGGTQAVEATLGEPPAAASDEIIVSGETAPTSLDAQPASVGSVSLAAPQDQVNEVPELPGIPEALPLQFPEAPQGQVLDAPAVAQEVQPIRLAPVENLQAWSPELRTVELTAPVPELGARGIVGNTVRVEELTQAGYQLPEVVPPRPARTMTFGVKEATLTPIEPQRPATSLERTPVGQPDELAVLPEVSPLEERAAGEPIPAQPPVTRGRRGLIVGSKTDQWANREIDQSLKEGRLFTGLDPKLSFAYAVKGAALIEQGLTDFAQWSASMASKYAGLTAENLQAIFAQAGEIMRQIRAGEQVTVPPEVRGASISTDDEASVEAEAARQNNAPPPTPDPESIEQAEEEGMRTVAVSPEVDPEKRRIVTEVLGQDFTVDGRRQWTPAEMQRSRNHARGVFAEAGIPVQWDSQRGIYVMVDPVTHNESAGRKLVEILKREFGRPRIAADPLFTVLVNSVRSQDGGAWTQQAFTPQTRNDLFAVSQGEASFYGLMLGALASAKRTLSWVATHVDTVLHKAYSDAFGGNQIGTVLTKVADEIEKQSGVDPRDKAAVERDKTKVEKARKRALENVKKRLSTRERRSVDRPIRGKKSLWQRIEEAVNAGIFDNASILQEIARANGWEVPTPVQLQRLKDMAEREKALRTTPQQEAVTKEERYRLMREMQTLWSRFSRPITWRTAEGRKNFGAAGGEYLSANMLLKLGFWVKQPIDVFSQVFWHVPTRALASAAQIARNDRAQGNTTQFWRDTGSALADASRNLIGEARNAVVQMQQGIRGRGELRNVEGIIGTINLFDRVRQRADELAAAGDHGRATLMRLFSWVQFSFRLARALDNAQGTFIVGQEQRERVIEELRSAGRTPEQARAEADTIMGDRTAEMALAVARAHEILQDQGIAHDRNQLLAAAYELFRARQYERMKAASLDADAIAQSNEYLRQTVGWNMPERKGLGGAIGGSVRNIGRALEEVGIPLPIGRFGNAIAIGINRALTWTPVGFFPSLFGGQENAWFRTPKDRVQRKMEAATGSAMGGLFIGMAMAGMIRVWNKGPDDPEERELWEKEGHRPGTVEFHVGGNKVLTLSMSTGPISYMRGVLGGIGTMQDVQAAHAKRARNLAREAEKRGLKSPAQEGLDANDLMGALAYGGYQAILGGRTAGGALRATIGQPESVSDFLRSFTASQTSPFVPLLPGIQEVQRARGVRMRYNMADFADLLLPTHDALGARRNFLNDPMIPSLLQSVIQTLTGGTYGPFEPGKDTTKPYRIFGRIEYRPESISRSQGFEIGDQFRPLSPEEWTKAMATRGDLLKAELEQLNEFETDEDLDFIVRDIAPQVRREALESVGAR